jgi:beta-galactosidase
MIESVIRMRHTRFHYALGLAAAAFLCAGHASRGANSKPLSPRERILITDDWRFSKGDPADAMPSLLYDVRPQPPKTSGAVKQAEANAVPNESAVSNNPPAVIKQWILPTANEFIKDPSRRFVRPMGDPGEGVACVQPGFDDRSWRRLNLPHDWAIEGPFSSQGGGGMGRLPSSGIGWYRKQLSIPAQDAGKSIFLDVDGAMSYAAVWLNGRLAGGWPYGYASWRLDLTPYVIPGGPNELAIRLDNPPNSSRWYPGGGIYRNVWLVKTAPVHVGHWGTYITTPEVSSSSASVYVSVEVANDSQQSDQVSISTEIFALGSNGLRTGKAVAAVPPLNVTLSPKHSEVVEGTAKVSHPKLWGPPPQQRPNRYLAVTTVSRANQVLDVYETPFGIRILKLDPSQGILMNGQPIPLNGVCDHHDLGALGAAVNYRALQRQLELLQEMGCNAIRTSHNPPAPELLELTDKMGLLVMDETFDVWVRSGFARSRAA